MSAPFAAWLWAPEDLPQALSAFAESTAESTVTSAPGPSPSPPRTAELDAWVAEVAAWAGLRARSIQAHLPDLGPMLRAAPLVASVQGRFLVVARADRRRATLVLPTGSRLSVPTARLRQSLEDLVLDSVRKELDGWLDLADVPDSRREKARRRLAGTLLGNAVLSGIWLCEPACRTRLGQRLVRAGVRRDLALFLAFHALQSVLFLIGWSGFGPAALAGTLQAPWILAWFWLLLLVVVGQSLRSWFQGRAAIFGGAALKRHLLDRILDDDLESTRRRGLGWSLARVFESEAIEQIALGGGLLVLTGALELGLAAWVLGKADPRLLLGLLAWSVVAVALALTHDRNVRQWLRVRLALTDERVEALVGHRTRLVQDTGATETSRDEAGLRAYHTSLVRRDRSAARLRAVVPAGWISLALGLLVLVSFGSPLAPTTLAIAVGGILLAASALDGVVRGSIHASVLHWTARQLESSLRSPRESQESAPQPLPWRARHTEAMTRPVVELSRVRHRYPGRRHAALETLDLSIPVGARIQLRGASGSGKSTLLGVLAGVRRPSEGRVRLFGLDVDSWSNETRPKIVGVVPQFHENHIFSERLAFNLLMGRSWPPNDADLAAAEEICLALGLGPLLQRLPSGLNQPIGDGGWALSHGERARVQLARALLAEPALLLADESFGALDPETRARCLAVCLERGSGFVVATHDAERSASDVDPTTDAGLEPPARFRSGVVRGGAEA